ncbi:MAG TPA: hypothetical protein VNQ90_12500 [Chthoniobacteraceae bacterium]|nr:hypothetical protein [Chthoniobacteraceae bacterium]
MKTPLKKTLQLLSLRRKALLSGRELSLAKRASGFSLLQLIITIALILGMAVLLFPAYHRVKDISKTARCAGQLRQIHTAMMQYAGEHAGRVPPYMTRRANPRFTSGYEHIYWLAWLRPYFNVPYRPGGAATDNTPEPAGVYRCPADTRPTGPYSGTDGSLNGSYGLCGLNGLLWGFYTYPGNIRHDYLSGFPLTKVEEPSATAMLFDHYRIFTSGPEQLREDADAFRHGGKINVVYFDGHVSSLSANTVPEGSNVFWGGPDR